MNKNVLDTTESLYDGKIKYTKKINTGLHYHRQFEMLYLVKGELIINTDLNSFHLSAGDIAVIKPFELHSFKELEKNTYLLIILPDRISLKLSSHNISTRRFENPGGDEKKLLMLYRTFLNVSHDYLWQYYKLAAEIIKKLYKLNTPFSGSNIVLDYIHGNFKDDITLTKVASACMSNRSYVSKAVNELTGCHFNSYINKLRISCFLDMFSSEDYNTTIESVSEKCGFNNPRTFYRAFFNELRCTPTEYFKHE